MEIRLKNISKRYGNSWVLHEISHAFRTGTPCAVTGPNGSGKSTLLKIVSGGLVPSGGQMQFVSDSGQPVHWSDAATRMAFAAPYIELIERLTLAEHIEFHFSFHRMAGGMDRHAFLDAIEMKQHRNKQVRDFSSGMKQRLKLALAFYTDSPVLLLDEPTSNLDSNWTNWYLREVACRTADRLVIIASNDPAEYACCTDELVIHSIS